MTKSIYPVLLKEKNLPFYLTGIGISDPEYHVYRENGLTSHQFLFTKSGKGVLKINGETFYLESGDFLYLPPSVPHEYFPLKDDWQTCWCVFRGQNIFEIMKALGFEEFFIKKMTDCEKIEQIFMKIFKLSEKSDSGELCSQYIYEYILAVKNFFYENKTILQNPVIKKTLEFIDLNYKKDITDEELAEKAGCSIQYFCRIFKKTMGMRPLEFIARKRISEAKNLLDSTELSLSEISQILGFNSLNYFGMVFKKYEGISASNYRERGHLQGL